MSRKRPHQLFLERWSGEKTILIPARKLKCYITGKLMKDTEHERNLQRLAQRLVREYDYEYDQLDRKFSVQIGSKRYYPDITAFHRKTLRKSGNVCLTVEIETEDVEPSDRNHGTGQLTSYMRMFPRCRYGLWYNGIRQISFYKEKPSEEPVEVNDIPPYGLEIEDIERPDFGQLKSATELRSVFKRCHNYIAGNQGLRKEEAFHELLKLIFCKALDESLSTRVQFYVTNNEKKEKPERCQSRINTLFRRVKSTHRAIFEEDELIKLDPGVVAYIVSQLQHYTLVNTDTDVKGDAYEEIVGGNLRGDRGEFFTPRNVCRGAVEMLFHTFPRSRWDDMMVIDPACGTGGFLVAVINFLKGQFLDMEYKKWGDIRIALDQVEERIKDFCERSLHGIDINPTLARATQMNEVMHGNGHGNVFPANSLRSSSDWKQLEKPVIRLGEFDCLFTNPPFGSKIPVTESFILENFDLGYIWEKGDGLWSRTKRLRKSVPPGQLFVEQAVRFLKSEGRLAMIIADHILTNPGLEFIRQWILENTKVVARIDLPGDTFQPFTGTNAHLVILERKKESDRGLGTVYYESFGAITKDIGHDKRGKTVYLRTPEGEEVFVEVEKTILRVAKGRKIEERARVVERVVNDDMPATVKAFKRWWNEHGW